MSLSNEELQAVALLLGPWLVGGCVDLLFQGVISCQIVNYFTYYSDDLPSLRIAVAGLAFLNVFKSCQSFALVWVNFINYFGDLNGAVMLNYTAWWQAGTPLIDGLLGAYVQTYFVYRLWVISKKWYIVAPIAAVFLFGLIAIVIGTYYISKMNDKQISAWFAAHLGSVFAGDVCLTLATAVFLLQSKKDVLPQTAGLIGALIRLTFMTAAPVAVTALLNLIFSQITVGSGSFISTAFNMAIPKIYAISMMYTLNARRTILVMHSSKNGVSAGASNDLSGGRSRLRRGNGDLELTTTAIQVLTHTETTQHIDVRDMFDKSNKSGRHLEGSRTQSDSGDVETVKY
ncbi:hypothetical protein MKEN_00496500 [Mycena kentingensis (nom. inval.)]|nr:hypothetical protein MKEN_00496500 [Mycena kentingensis (nom. inval.)]